MVSTLAVAKAEPLSVAEDGAPDNSTGSGEEGCRACGEDALAGGGDGAAAAGAVELPHARPKFPTTRHQRGGRGGKKRNKDKHHEAARTRASRPSVPQPAYIMKGDDDDSIGLWEEGYAGWTGGSVEMIVIESVASLRLRGGARQVDYAEPFTCGLAPARAPCPAAGRIVLQL